MNTVKRICSILGNRQLWKPHGHLFAENRLCRQVQGGFQTSLAIAPTFMREMVSRLGALFGDQRFTTRWSQATTAKTVGYLVHMHQLAIAQGEGHHLRLKGWMHRFYGVATKNLDNYLGWHRMLDKSDGGNMNGKAFMSASFR